MRVLAVTENENKKKVLNGFISAFHSLQSIICRKLSLEHFRTFVH